MDTRSDANLHEGRLFERMQISLQTFPILTSILVTVNSNYQMIVTWGRPTNASGALTPPTSLSSWSDCVSYCYNDLYCVLVHGTLNWCNVYYFDTAFEVEELSSETELMVAMKMSTSLTSCSSSPYEKSEVTFTDPSYQYTSFNYSIQYSDGSWGFSYTTIRTCPADWKAFTRPLADVCLRLYAGVTSTWIQTEATSLCAEQHATLAGFENSAERAWALEQGLKINKLDSKNAAGFWVAGTRRKACATLAESATSDCYQTKAFDLEDKYLTTVGGYQWAPNTPDGVNATGIVQGCVMLWVQKQASTDKLNGTVDDLQCTFRFNDYFNVRGYFCVKPAGL